LRKKYRRLIIMKITKILLVLFAITVAFSCKKDDTPDPFDHEAQALIDDEVLKTFLETHYYTPPILDEHFGVVDTIQDGETSLLSQVTTQEVKYANIDFKIYYLKVLPEGVNDSPSKVDSTLVNYKGLLLKNINGENRTVFDSKSNYSFWANLYGQVIPGWSYGISNFKSGINNSIPDEAFDFSQTGKGLIFIPSGLAYQNGAKASIPANSPLMFHIELAMVKHNDQDKDGLFSIFEDINNDGDFSNDDSDGDGKDDFIDFDDDNDGLATRFENADVNGDHNPADAVDTDTDGTPDYLDDDDDGDGILTINENADPNHDGNPEDAEDEDGDNIPDYLDRN